MFNCGLSIFNKRILLLTQGSRIRSNTWQFIMLGRLPQLKDNLYRKRLPAEGSRNGLKEILYIEICDPILNVSCQSRFSLNVSYTLTLTSQFANFWEWLIGKIYYRMCELQEKIKNLPSISSAQRHELYWVVRQQVRHASHWSSDPVMVSSEDQSPRQQPRQCQAIHCG